MGIGPAHGDQVRRIDGPGQHPHPDLARAGRDDGGAADLQHFSRRAEPVVIDAFVKHAVLSRDVNFPKPGQGRRTVDGSAANVRTGFLPRAAPGPPTGTVRPPTASPGLRSFRRALPGLPE
ncbi:hypothetical protein [Paenibacillus chitinolyticus]|uniref:hypothetical protein n=1 Tax=Paenibacillus chitinolyticus TaxID=79263 RepID=UPI00295EF8AF|nr:hypothetical protein [Paenibacillus chitinolyticus]